MDARPRPPLRLSLEERVSSAVQDAVQRALIQQRMRQEKELDNLSDALQKSLAALAGERDRALRSLSAEEDRRYEMVEDLSTLMGEELTCVDLSRLAMGLERIEHEDPAKADGGRGEGETADDRSWVLEQLRRCLYARAEAQDYLRTAGDEVATDLFEAEEFMGFESNSFEKEMASQMSTIFPPPPSPPLPLETPHTDSTDTAGGTSPSLATAAAAAAMAGTGSTGVARARSAASDALQTSLRLARERVEYLEGLMLDVQGGTDGGQHGSPSSSSALSAVKARRREGMAGEGDGAKPAARDVRGHSSSGASDRPGVERSRRHAVDTRVVDDCNRGASDGALGGPVGVPVSPSVRGGSAGDDRVQTPPENAAPVLSEEEDENAKGEKNEKEERSSQPLSQQEQPIQRQPQPQFDTINDTQRSTGEDAFEATMLGTAGAAEREDGYIRPNYASPHDSHGSQGSSPGSGWRKKGNPRETRASRRAEESLADLNETLGSVLALSFRCGAENARHWHGRGESEGRTQASETSGISIAYVGTMAGEETVDGTEGSVNNESCDADADAGTAAAAAAAGTAAAAAAVMCCDSGSAEAKHGGDRGSGGVSDVGICCEWRQRCSGCEARTTAVETLVERLQALFAVQGDEIANMDASLHHLRRRTAAPVSATRQQPRGARKAAGGPIGGVANAHDDGSLRRKEQEEKDACRGGAPRPFVGEGSEQSAGVASLETPAAEGVKTVTTATSGSIGNTGGTDLQGGGADALGDTRNSSNSNNGNDMLTSRMSSTLDQIDPVRPSHGSGGASLVPNSPSAAATSSVRGDKDGTSEAAALGTREQIGGEEKRLDQGVAREGVRRALTAEPQQRDLRSEWEELEGLDTYLEHYRGGRGGGGLGSPAVQGVLDRWIDISKRRILEGWLAHVLHGGPVDAANGCFVPRVQISSLSKEVRDGLVSVVLPLLLGRRGVLLQVLTRERVEVVHDIQIRVTPVAGRRDGPFNARTAAPGNNTSRRRGAPMSEREHGARIRGMVMKAAHAGYVEEDEGGGVESGVLWRAPLASVDSLSRQLKETWESFNVNLAVAGDGRGGGGAGRGMGGWTPLLPEY